MLYLSSGRANQVNSFVEFSQLMVTGTRITEHFDSVQSHCSVRTVCVYRGGRSFSHTASVSFRWRAILGGPRSSPWTTTHV